MKKSSNTIKLLFILPLIILLIPLIAMQFSDEVNWNVMDFVVAAVLLYGAVITAYLVSQKIKSKNTKITMIILLLVIIILIWMEMAVGLFGTPLAGE